MPRLLRRHVALPTEHGAWAFLLSPLILGLFAGGRWRLTTTYLVVAALCAFLVRQPITRAIKALGGRTKGDDLPAALAWIALYGGLGLLHVLGLVVRGEGYVLWLAVPGVPVFGWYLWLVWRRAERHQVLVEVVGAGALALAAPAALWVGRAAYVPAGWLLFGLAWAHTTFLIALAHLRLVQRRWSALPPRAEAWRAARLPLGVALAESVAVAAGCLAGWWPRLLWLPYALQVLQVAVDVRVPAIRWSPKRIGVRLFAVTAVFTALFVLVLRYGA